MNIFSNLVNGSVNYKKIVDDYMAKDRSVTASYGRNHINRPTQGYLGLLLLVAFVGLISFAFGSGELQNSHERSQDRRNGRPDGNRFNNNNGGRRR